MSQALIIDDEKELGDILCEIVTSLGHSAQWTPSLAEGMEKCRKNVYDVVFLDVRLPDGNGIDFMPEIRKSPGSPEIIIMTGFADPESAERAIRKGAWDYLQKPISPKSILMPIKRILQYRDNLKKKEQDPAALRFDGIIGNSPAMQKCLRLLAHAAESDANVLITGETGTGKELFARAIHGNSARAAGPFVVVDCASLPKTLIESVLFGSVRGAFTGADTDRDGLILGADKGTLFLDEIGELPFSIQKAFLRVIQERRFRPVGSSRELASNFRLVAATHRDLNKMAAGGNFRSDLLFRLQTVVIRMPPLRERLEDLEGLANFHLHRVCTHYRISQKVLSPDFLQLLAGYEWPGNIRELMNVLDFAVVTAKEEPVLFAKDLPEHIRVDAARKAVKPTCAKTSLAQVDAEAPADIFPAFSQYRQERINEAEKNYFKKLMALTRGDIRQSCRISGLGRTRLYALLKKHDISRYGWSKE